MEAQASMPWVNKKYLDEITLKRAVFGVDWADPEGSITEIVEYTEEEWEKLKERFLSTRGLSSATRAGLEESVRKKARKSRTR